ncbi:MAG: ATP-dependent sacrificial sulfur transferase LarE [Clostridia bacterium]|nr:ATP-dependent sacrificial sulfur transferase LarE [Clostridia bacterium]NCC74854.1 ATP-dependent sacrificial sulfur transferase LarE [Clostridia bacterium]
MSAGNQRQPDELLSALAEAIKPLGKIAVASSGGVDSTVLLVAAAHILGPDQVLAVTALAPMVPLDDQADASRLSDLAGVRHLVARLPESILDLPPFAENPPDRCYHCKKIIFDALLALARGAGFKVLCDGTNRDDLKDYRPGLRALQEMKVVSPLAEAGFTKAEVRTLAALLCPDVAAKPAMACLATRIPTHTPVTLAAMARIDKAESLLRQKGLDQVRVRDHAGLARVELDPAVLERGLAPELIALLRDSLNEAGFDFATLDLQGYRSGSMNPAAKPTGQEETP